VPRYKLTIEYAGTQYSGWQKQKNARTVQGELERAIGERSREKTFEFMGSGRTDAGVHALRQVAHLDVRKTLPAETLRAASTTGCQRTSTCSPSTRCRIAFTRGTPRWRAVTSIRSRDDARRLLNRSCGG
jgi:hypothetical protein